MSRFLFQIEIETEESGAEAEEAGAEVAGAGCGAPGRQKRQVGLHGKLSARGLGRWEVRMPLTS